MNGSPVWKRCRRSDVIADSIFHFGSVPLLWFAVEDLLEVGHLSM
jgi:hypothetical protein